MNIAGIRSVATQPVFPPPMRQADAGRPGAKVDFGQMIKEAVNAVDQDQDRSAASIQQLLSGKQKDVLPVVAAVAKADMSFKLLIGIRNKMIEAYKQTLNMPL